MSDVTQADRDAAAAYWKVSRIGNAETQRRYLSGEADASFIVQAFAAHREAIEAEIAAWLRRARTDWKWNDAADAIERGEYRSKSDG